MRFINRNTNLMILVYNYFKSRGHSYLVTQQKQSKENKEETTSFSYKHGLLGLTPLSPDTTALRKSYLKLGLKIVG